jgi:succinyl-CoA synthetase beta subunit
VLALPGLGRAARCAEAQRGAQVRADTSFVELLDVNPWLKTTRLVVKPDMLFGKRGKHDLARPRRLHQPAPSAS